MSRKKIIIFTLLGACAALFAASRLRVFESAAWTWLYFSKTPLKVERPLAAGLPPCPGCNLLLISLDTFRADRMGYLGNTSGLTPNLDKIAAKSLVFSRAYTNAFFTTPSHMTIFTSLYPTTHRVEGEDMKLKRNPRTTGAAHILDPRFTTLAEVLKSSGYKTYWNAPLRFKFLELEEGFGRGFSQFQLSPFDRGLDFNGPHDVHFLKSSLAPLAGHDKAFVFLHSYVTHHPYIWREGKDVLTDAAIPYTQNDLLREFEDMVTLDPGVLSHMLGKFPMSVATETKLIDACTDFQNMIPCLKTYSSPDRFWHAIGQLQVRRAGNYFHGNRLDKTRAASQLELYKKAYDGGVKLLDREVGEMWRELEDSGALAHTLVVIVSDHGEELFENGEGSHSSFYEHTARVPMIIYHPKLKDPVMSDQLVSLVDVMPLALSLLEVPPPQQVQGRLPWEKASPYVFGYAIGNDYAKNLNWKLMRTYDGAEQLYYLPADPTEQHNLMDLPNPWVRSAYLELRQARANWMVDQSL